MSNNLSTISEIWKVLKASIEAGDTTGAADILVNYMIDEEYSPVEIKKAFRGDSEIKEALSFFLETPDDALYVSASTDELYDELYDEDDDFAERDRY